MVGIFSHSFFSTLSNRILRDISNDLSRKRGKILSNDILVENFLTKVDPAHVVQIADINFKKKTLNIKLWGVPPKPPPPSLDV